MKTKLIGEDYIMIDILPFGTKEIKALKRNLAIFPGRLFLLMIEDKHDIFVYSLKWNLKIEQIWQRPIGMVVSKEVDIK